MSVALSERIDLARRIRAQALRMVHRAKASHIGGCLSAADLLAHLYGGWLKIDPARPDWSERDRFLLSKGHAAAAIYAVLAEQGFFPRAWLETYCGDGARLGGHVTSHGVPGVEVSTGSLGHGLPLGLGMALGFKRAGRANRVVVLMSDGECDEGAVWEAALMAPHWGCDNLLAIVDYNKIQSLGSVAEVAPLEPFADKWRAFRWAVREIDGHSHGEIAAALAAFPFDRDRPSLLIAHTVKGKGVSFMEGKLLWHYRSPSDEQLAQALREIGESGAGA
jgi:transketolase